MTLTAVIILLVMGILLMIAEVMVIPGVGFVGILGFLLLVLAVYFGYEISNTTGHIVLISAGVSSVGILSLRSKTWDRVALKTQLKGKSNPYNYEELFKIGQKGKTSSRLNPIGKAIFDDKVVEVKSYSDFVDSNQEIEIVNIEGNKIIVKTVKK
jgi:membrane-bound ClpP family serine protease